MIDGYKDMEAHKREQHMVKTRIEMGHCIIH